MRLGPEALDISTASVEYDACMIRIRAHKGHQGFRVGSEFIFHFHPTTHPDNIQSYFQAYIPTTPTLKQFQTYDDRVLNPVFGNLNDTCVTGNKSALFWAEIW